MGQATRTTILSLDLASRDQGGANTSKRQALEETVRLLTAARAFYVDFFLAHPAKLWELVQVVSLRTGEMEDLLLSAHNLLTWAEEQTVETHDHPEPLPGWNFTGRFPDFPYLYRRSVIKDAIGKVRGYLSMLATWHVSGKSGNRKGKGKKDKPGLPGSADHPTLYHGTFQLEVGDGEPVRDRFVRLKVCRGGQWVWAHYPVKASRYFQQRLADPSWATRSPTLVARAKYVAFHFPQVKVIKARKVVESKRDPGLVTVAVDLNVKQLAVITARQHGQIEKTVFVRDGGLDQHRYRHLTRVGKKQWQSGKPVKGEQSNQQLWRHIRRQNRDVAHKAARAIAQICAQYPGCVLLFERLRKMRRKGGSKSRRLNRKQANQLRGQINRLAREKAYAQGTVTVEVNPHGTSQYCSRCGARGERFSLQGGRRHKGRGGKLFWCPVCQYEVQADFNASANVHHSFYQEVHWQPRLKRSG
jgi:IS605 OrfB family transposase